MPGVALSVPEGSDPTVDGGLVDGEERLPLVGVALATQADVVTGGVVVVWGGAVVLWQTGRGDPSADAAAVCLAVSSSHG